MKITLQNGTIIDLPGEEFIMIDDCLKIEDNEKYYGNHDHVHGYRITGAFRVKLCFNKNDASDYFVYDKKKKKKHIIV